MQNQGFNQNNQGFNQNQNQGFNQQPSNRPIDKGRVTVIAEKYPTNETDQTGQPVIKNRYATVGRATKWPAQQANQEPRIDIEIDTMPIGVQAPVKMFIFWDSEQNNGQG